MHSIDQIYWNKVISRDMYEPKPQSQKLVCDNEKENSWVSKETYCHWDKFTLSTYAL